MSGVDTSLIKRCIKRNESALYTLYRHCYPMMNGIAMRYVFDNQRRGEVVNNGFLKIVNGLSKYDPSQPFNPWASTVMIRVALDYVRKEMRSSFHQTDLYEDMSTLNGQKLAYNEADQAFDSEELLIMLANLPEQMRVVFNLFAIEGFSHKEIGVQLDISEGTSKWYVSKAREQLKAELLSKMKKKRSDYEPSH